MSKLRDKFKRKPALKREDVTDLLAPLADLGGERVYVQALVSAQRDEYEASKLVETFLPSGKRKYKLNLANTKANLVVKALVDESGARVFTDTDADWIGQEYPADIVDKLFDVACKLSGIETDEDEEAKKPDGQAEDVSPIAWPSMRE